jgi:N-acetylglucosaminyldiphosphoundecaprenol N-acetyl-beta-D-mannosaminyltransferase
VQATTKGRSRSASVLDVRVNRLRRAELLDEVVETVRHGRRQTIVYVNAHCMNVQHRDPMYRDILASADIVYCDGMGVVLAARLTGQAVPERMTGADWIEDLCRTAVEHNLSLYLLGSAPAAVHGAASVLGTRYPDVHIVGAMDGYHVGPATIADINRRHPDVLLVGMGVPRQEKWIAHHRAELDVPVVWAVGGLFDVVSGRVPRGPRWMTQHGLEWLYRLIVEPRRLWRRYLLGNPRFLWHVLSSQTRLPTRNAGARPRDPVTPTRPTSI